MDPKKQSLRQLVEQLRNQQPVISKDATLRSPIIFQPNKTADIHYASQETDPELKGLDHRREGRLLGPGVHGGAPAQQQSPTTDQEMDKVVSQLKSLKLNKTELAVAIQSMPSLNRIRKDPERFTALLNQAAVQRLAQGYEDTRPPQESQYPQGSTAFRRPQRAARGQQDTK